MIKIFIIIFSFIAFPVYAGDFVDIKSYNPIIVPDTVEVMLSNDTYLVSHIAVSGFAESDTQAFDNGLYAAKFIAFRALKNKLYDSSLLEDSEVIDSAMVGFVPVDGTFEEGNYRAQFDILFDRDKIANLITEFKMVGQQKARTGSESIVARISIKNDLKTWIKIRERLNKSKIPYLVISLNLNEVELLFKQVNAENLTKDLKENDLDFVPNRDFYFIKLPFFS